MGDAGHDLGVNVGRDGVKGLWFGRGSVGEERTEVAWLNLGDDATVGDAFVVVGDCEMLVELVIGLVGWL
jgi:hypothetical protein